jgi:hypothetical protein
MTKGKEFEVTAFEELTKRPPEIFGPIGSLLAHLAASAKGEKADVVRYLKRACNRSRSKTKAGIPTVIPD